MPTTSPMLRPSIVTARDSGLRRVPRHDGQGVASMNASSSTRIESLSVSSNRRWIVARMPSHLSGGFAAAGLLATFVAALAATFAAVFRTATFFAGGADAASYGSIAGIASRPYSSPCRTYGVSSPQGVFRSNCRTSASPGRITFRR